MRFVTFHTPGDRAQRFGLRMGDSQIVDLERATALRLLATMPAEGAARAAQTMTPGEAVAFMRAGEAALSAAGATLDFVKANLDRAIEGIDGKPAVLRLDAIVLDTPVPNSGKFIAAGKNFVEHLAEMTKLENPKAPVAFCQMNTTFAAHGARIAIPVETAQLDYEVEIAIVIGKPAYRVSVADAMDYVFGFTIFNDLSARDVYRAEQGAGVPLLGKNVAMCGPLGPHIVTRDEFADPTTLRLMTRVNGETRQNSTLKGMLFSIPELVSWWSQMGLEPGDLISGGTPSGVAAGRKPGETPWWLKPGDIVECEIEGIGVLRTEIVHAG